MNEESRQERLQEWDAQREGFPGEHWIVLGLGIGVWLLARRHRSVLVQVAGVLAGTALVARAASGREGLSKVLRLTPLGGGLRRR